MTPSPPALDPVAGTTVAADHIVCMTCGCHVQHGWLPRHYASLHPDLEASSGDAVTRGGPDE